MPSSPSIFKILLGLAPKIRSLIPLTRDIAEPLCDILVKGSPKDVARLAHGLATYAQRVREAPTVASKLEEQAKWEGAKFRFVTGGGLTYLPPAMIKELKVGDGAYVWFLRGKDHWEAWPETEVNAMFGGDG